MPVVASFASLAPTAGKTKRNVHNKHLDAQQNARLGTKVFPSAEQPTTDTTSRRDSRAKILSFSDAFGLLGVPMLLTLLTCIVWTTWLIVVALEPNQTANWLMGTSTYDNGQFWLISDKTPSIAVAGAIGLAIVDLCYVYAAVKMLRWRGRLDEVASAFQLTTDVTETQESVNCARVWWRLSVAAYHGSRHFYKELTSFSGNKRKFWNVSSKAFNLTMQVFVLLDLLKSGSPAVLVLGYATLVAINSLSCAVNIFYGKLSAVAEVLVSSIFDWFATVAHPIVVLAYCYSTFNFDHATFRTFLEKLPPSSFEHQARTFADPSQVALFRLNFGSLRTRSVLDLALRVGMNLSFCYRIKRIGDILVTSQHNALSRVQKPVPKALSAVFIAFSIAVWILTFQAIAESRAKCSQHPKCVVYSYRRGYSDGMCPCQIFISVDPAPQTYEEWISPFDVYNEVKELAASGELRSIQIVNRQLLELPTALRSCRYLEFIELVYTSTQSLPPWTNEFTSLEFLHVEGKPGSQNLRALPEDLFSNMPRLSTIHFAVHVEMKSFPALTGVPNLRSLTLAWLLPMTELPVLDRVPLLQILIIAIMPQIEKMPDMTSQQNLAEFVITRPRHICCNGFTGACRLDDSSCASNPITNSPTTCIEEEPFTGSTSTKAVFEAFSSTLCQQLPPGFNPLASIPTKESIEMCDNRPFGQCELPDGREGICYNTRMQVLACLADEVYIALRRFQIEKGIPCNVTIEEWLGCRK